MEIQLVSKTYQISQVQVGDYTVSASKVVVESDAVITIEGGNVVNEDNASVCSFSLTSYAGAEPSITIPTCKRSINATAIIDSFCEAVETYQED